MYKAQYVRRGRSINRRSRKVLHFIGVYTLLFINVLKNEAQHAISVETWFRLCGLFSRTLAHLQRLSLQFISARTHIYTCSVTSINIHSVCRPSRGFIFTVHFIQNCVPQVYHSITLLNTLRTPVSMHKLLAHRDTTSQTRSRFVIHRCNWISRADKVNAIQMRIISVTKVNGFEIKMKKSNRYLV